MGSILERAFNFLPRIIQSPFDPHLLRFLQHLREERCGDGEMMRGSKEIQYNAMQDDTVLTTELR